MLQFPAKPTRLSSDAAGQPCPVVPPPHTGSGPWSDAALDAVLAGVELPEGMLGRLNALVAALPDFNEERSD